MVILSINRFNIWQNVLLFRENVFDKMCRNLQKILAC